MKVLFAYADTPQEWNTSQWRCILPMRAINMVEGWEAQSINLMTLIHGESDPWIEWADIIIIERLLIAEVLTAIETWKALGKTVLGTLDDDYQHMPRSVAAYGFWHQGMVERNGYTQPMKPTPIEQLQWGVKLVDGLLVASKQLQKDWLALTPNVYWFPNYMDTFSYIQARKTTPPGDRLTIGWGGSFTHVESWKGSGILQALREVLEVRSHVDIVIAGGDTNIFDLLRVPFGRKRLVRWQNFDQWPKTLSTFDIGLVPLSGTYDERRSWIKAIEYMVMGIPWIGSDCVTLRDVGDLGILVPNSYNGWRRALLHVIDHYEKYLQRAQDFANEYPRVDIGNQGIALVHILEKAVANRERKLL